MEGEAFSLLTYAALGLLRRFFVSPTIPAAVGAATGRAASAIGIGSTFMIARNFRGGAQFFRPPLPPRPGFPGTRQRRFRGNAPCSRAGARPRAGAKLWRSAKMISLFV